MQLLVDNPSLYHLNSLKKDYTLLNQRYPSLVKMQFNLVQIAFAAFAIFASADAVCTVKGKSQCPQTCSGFADNLCQYELYTTPVKRGKKNY